MSHCWYTYPTFVLLSLPLAATFLYNQYEFIVSNVCSPKTKWFFPYKYCGEPTKRIKGYTISYILYSCKYCFVGFVNKYIFLHTIGFVVAAVADIVIAVAAYSNNINQQILWIKESTSTTKTTSSNTDNNWWPYTLTLDMSNNQQQGPYATSKNKIVIISYCC